MATESDIAIYKQYRNTFTQVKRFCKSEYDRSKCEEYKGNTKKLWKVINNTTKSLNDKSSVIECLLENDVCQYNPKKIVNMFNDHFSSVGKNFTSKIPKSEKNINHYLNKISCNAKSLFLHPTNKMEVITIIKSLPNKKSSGHDQIDNSLLKLINDEISASLCCVFNKSMTQGIFPDIMKLAEVVPLYKNKDNRITSNYRPISFLIMLSKVLEKIIHK